MTEKHFISDERYNPRAKQAEFQVMIMKTTEELRVRMNEQSEKLEVLKKELENIKNQQRNAECNN